MINNRYSRLLWVGLIVIPFLLLSIHGDAFASKAPATGDLKYPKPPGNHARSAALVDVISGRILFSQRGNEPMKIASLTKIMTAIVAIEHGDLDSKVKVSVRAAGKEGSSLYLKAGQQITLRNVLYGLMLRSGNDAAMAIAEHVGGSVEGFAYLMNKKADEIGLTHSHFMNPHGLDQEGHYSTANDLAKLTAYALHNPEFKAIVKTRVKSAPNPNDNWDYKWVNKNKMLTMYDGADGVKTGYTKQALRCLVSSATRNGQQLVAVTLNDGDDWLDHRKLLDFGFANFPLTTVTKTGDPIAGFPYQVASDFAYPLIEGEREHLEVRLAPLRAGTVEYKLGYRGQLKFVLNNQLIGTVPFIDNKQTDEPSSTRVSSHRSFVASIGTALKALFLQGGL
ncbi:D-alanyl-D-alanine carboxypeptidase [Cohnella sp. NL03-T5]|nr:D-alanyl-D-alanine carboxypeptidase [Cohnella silvisoli]